MAVAALALSLLFLIFFSIMMFRMMRIRMTTTVGCMHAAAVAGAPSAMEEGFADVPKTLPWLVIIIIIVHACCYACGILKKY